VRLPHEFKHFRATKSGSIKVWRRPPAGRFSTDQQTFISGDTFEQACKRFEINLISKTLNTNSSNITHAARVLGVPRTTLRRKIESLGIKV
jgi:DNA-binding NtrC family response regulator